MNCAVVATSLVRSHVVFKYLNYVTDKIVSSANYISAYFKLCANYICVCEGETESGRERVGNVLPVHSKM